MSKTEQTVEGAVKPSADTKTPGAGKGTKTPGAGKGTKTPGADKAAKNGPRKVRMLRDYQDHKCGEVVSMKPAEIKSGLEASAIDDSPEAVAYAEKVIKAKATLEKAQRGEVE